MNVLQIGIAALSLAVLNAAVFLFLKKYLAGRHDAALIFMLVNFPKDILWIVSSIGLMDKTRGNFLALTAVFLVGGSVLYYHAVRFLNKS